MDINQRYSLFRLHFIPERNKLHSRADFFGITREKHESAEDVWTRILQVEKNCEFENVTPAELIASKFLSVIGRSTGDYELKKKIRKSDMTIETITALIHEHMYDRLNDSNNSNDGKELNVMRTTVHSSIKETPFERHYGRKSRTEIHNYLNISPNKHYNVSARPETLQVYTFTNGNGAYDQLVMKAPRELKEDVSNKFPYYFSKRNKTNKKLKAHTKTNHKPQ